MKQKKYKRIDKRLITKGSQIDFNLFLPNETKSAMSLFLQSDTAVDGDAKVKLRELSGCAMCLTRSLRNAPIKIL
ncbi:MAG: hypothetical protein IE884_04460 [Sulfuricurvum sp.]|nr:hypothetical protein [Sulfuricurvum sp.]